MNDTELTTPDFSDSVDLAATDAGDAISAITMPDFSNSADIPSEPDAIDKSERLSMISRIARTLVKFGPIERIKTAWYLQDKMPEPIEGESRWDYRKRVDAVLQPREEAIIKQGIGKVLETPMQVGIVAGALAAPIETAAFVGLYSLADKFVNLRRYTEKNFPDTAPEAKDIIEIADFIVKGGIIGKGVHWSRGKIVDAIHNIGVPKNVNLSSSNMGKLKESVNLLPEEKTDLMNTLGIKEKHIETSVNSGLPTNVPTEKIIDLAQKPYWDRARAELFPEVPKPAEIVPEPPPSAKIEPKLSPTEGKVTPEVKKAEILKKQGLIKGIKDLVASKNLSAITVSKLKKSLSIDNIKRASEEQLNKLTSFINDLKPEDKFLSDKQVKALNDLLKELPVPEITPKRIIVDRFGEKSEILSDKIVNAIEPGLIPTVDIKEGQPLIKRTVEKARMKLQEASKENDRRNKQLDTMLTKAEKSRVALLPVKEKISRAITPQNKEIFQALSGQRVELTKEEVAVVAYLKNFFNMAKENLKLEKYRKHYVTNLEKSLSEKILTRGIFGAVKDILSMQKQKDLPIDIMLELDNIIGSEKFFRFALERKGGIDPTTNLRQIIGTYSNMYETKLALDAILPEGQAITKTLLQGKSAVWMKRYLQNLKGRGLDSNFRNGPMGWLAKVADGVIDFGYIKLLGLNWKSALKNIVAGETNSWIYQDFPTYLKGKQRFWADPKKAYTLANEYGILQGTYADYAQKGIGRLKQLQDLTMVGQQGGEVEIRGSIFASMLTDKEWASGKIPSERIQEIQDVVAITQGVFSKVDSPLILQTWYGRMFFQMNRWRITNAMLLRRITTEAAVDIKAGKFNTQNTTRLGKTLVAYGVGMYLSYELNKAGYKKAGDVARNMAQTIDGVTSLVTEGDLIKMFTDNPTLSIFKEIFSTIQNFAYYIHVPGARKTKEKGIEDTYIAPLENIKDIVEEVNPE